MEWKVFKNIPKTIPIECEPLFRIMLNMSSEDICYKVKKIIFETRRKSINIYDSPARLVKHIRSIIS